MPGQRDAQRIELRAADIPALDGMDHWIEVKPGMPARTAIKVQEAGDLEVAQLLAYLSEQAVAWSWSEPISPESLASLDMEVLDVVASYLGDQGFFGRRQAEPG